MKRQLFRKAALDRLSSPESIDPLLMLRPSPWRIGLIGLTCLLAAFSLWGILGRLPVNVSGTGRLVEREIGNGQIQRNHIALQAVLFVDRGDEVVIRPGMKAFINPTEIEREIYGDLLGRVVLVSVPSEIDGSLLKAMGDQKLIRDLTVADISVVAVIIELVQDPENISGFKWTFPKGPPWKIRGGTQCSGTITVAHISPIRRVLLTLGGS